MPDTQTQTGKELLLTRLGDGAQTNSTAAASFRTKLGLGDAATKTAGAASGNVPVLDGSGKLGTGVIPAIAQSGVTNLVTDLVAKANAASPALTGTPTAPTASPGTSTTQLATTAFVTTADNLKAPLASPALTGTPTVPTAAQGNNSTQIASTAYADTLGATKPNKNFSVVTVTGTTLTLDASNAGPDILIRLTSTTAITITVSTGLASGIQWNIRQGAAGVATVGGVGITVNGNASTAGVNTSLWVGSTGTNTVEVEGGV